MLPLATKPRLAVAFHRLRLGPFEGPAIVKPPALPEDTYFRVDGYECHRAQRIGVRTIVGQ